MPQPTQLAGPWSWWRAITLSVAAGSRPCTGALGVLVVANSIGLLWAGIVSTFVMSLGTAITVSVLVAFAVGSRDRAIAWTGGSDSVWAPRVQLVAGLAGAALVIALGAYETFDAFTNTDPL